MYWVETVVCSGQVGKDARLMRMLELRQEFKRRQEGCITAWIARNPDQKELFLVHSVFVSQEAWREISQKALDQLDAKDGGIESLLAGPPLVGVFEAKPEHFVNNTNDGNVA
ncbi:MAG: antibiotic biosynthesis monooxygenase [Candidatus Poseidoniales archaeon]